MSTQLPHLNIPNPVPDGQSPPPTITIPGAVIHSVYDRSAIPPKPTNGNWTRFVCISDTHEQNFPVPDGDVLLHSGDLSHTGMVGGMTVAMNWLYSLPHRKKIIIAGNHDLSLHRGWYDQQFSRWHSRKQDPATIRTLVKGIQAQQAGIVYLENEMYELRTQSGRVWTIYGSPWTPNFGGWAFNYDRGKESDEVVSSFPKTDILLTHGPPYSVLDRTTGDDRAGCESLLARLPAVRPRLHLFGHIHEGHGVQVGEWLPAGSEPATATPEHTVFVNAAAWPMGERLRQEGIRVPFGTGPFAPVIVDLCDDV